MIIDYFQNICYLDFVAILLEYQSVRMNQIHRILSFPILGKGMTSSNVELDHHFNSVCRANFIYTLMYFIGHFSAVGSLCSFGIRTNLFDFVVLVRDIQTITSLSDLPLR
ncbi:hypothetical protein [Phocaeicola sartorii]|uniref:hypothetical protein n=1 Tax=Phocaeicola sartorii TaxID=671267 RepID=UPI0025A9F320|nr:hypothetical protein [Phocaeicola sartorii]